MRWGVMGSVAQLIALFCGLPFGTIGVAVAYVITMYLLFVPAIAYAGHPLGIGAKDVIRTVGPQLIGALASALFGFELLYAALGQLHPLARLPILILACAALYLVIVVGLFKITHPLDVARNVMKDMAPKALARVPGFKLAEAARKD
jgi:PST family polysaccharide transporter